jgi:primosomal protein N''
VLSDQIEIAADSAGSNDHVFSSRGEIFTSSLIDSGAAGEAASRLSQLRNAVTEKKLKTVTSWMTEEFIEQGQNQALTRAPDHVEPRH